MKKIAALIYIIIFFISFSYPAFAKGDNLYNLEGKKISFKEITAHPKTVLSLWSVWCPACREEMSNFNPGALPKDVKFFYVNLGDKKAEIKEFIASLGLNMAITKTILLDSDLILPEKLFIIGVPFILFFQEGKLLKTSFYFDENILKETFK